MNRRLYRSPDDRVLAGVAGGMAEAYALDPAVVRVLWALLIILTGGLFLILYIVMAFVVPLRPTSDPLGPDDQTRSWAAGPPPVSSTGSPPTTGPFGATWHAARRERREDSDNNGPIVVGAILILVGGLFLLRQFVDIDLGRLWPIVVIVIGLVLIVSAFARRPGPG
jgi:phage shock protein C